VLSTDAPRRPRRNATTRAVAVRSQRRLSAASDRHSSRQSGGQRPRWQLRTSCTGLDGQRPRVRVVHCDVRVQGAAASRRIVWALRRLASLDLDAIAIVRGGGARSDLAAFDSEIVARRDHRDDAPSSPASGHETDRNDRRRGRAHLHQDPHRGGGRARRAGRRLPRTARHLAHQISVRSRSVGALAQRSWST